MNVWWPVQVCIPATSQVSNPPPTPIKRMDGAIQCKRPKCLCFQTVWLYFQVWYWRLSVNFGGPHWLSFQQGQKDEGLEEDEGVSRVRVTCRRSPHKVERVSGLVTRSHIDIPEVSEAEQPGYQRGKGLWFIFFCICSTYTSEKQMLLLKANTNNPHDGKHWPCQVQALLFNIVFCIFIFWVFYNFAFWADFVISSTACPLWLQSLC